MHSNACIDDNLAISVLASLDKDGHFETAGDVLKCLQRYEEAKAMYERSVRYIHGKCVKTRHAQGKVLLKAK